MIVKRMSRVYILTFNLNQKHKLEEISKVFLGGTVAKSGSKMLISL